jgi:hypothetical protein
MVMRDYKQELVERIERMNESQQMRVLDFVEQLQRPKGLSGAEAIRIAKEIDFDSESLNEMQRAVEEGREVIDDEPPVIFND